jgi:hypothetical protein
VYDFPYDLVGIGLGLCSSTVWHPNEQHVSCLDGFAGLRIRFGTSFPGSCFCVFNFHFSLTVNLSIDFHVSTVSICFAKHVQDKAARWAKSKRPRKSRASDINRKPIIYEVHSMTKPAEYSISDAPAVPMAKPARTEN